LLREETISIVLEVRLNNEIRKQERQQLAEKKEKLQEQRFDNINIEFTGKGVKINEN
jgi:hypothetical protein